MPHTTIAAPRTAMRWALKRFANQPAMKPIRPIPSGMDRKTTPLRAGGRRRLQGLEGCAGRRYNREIIMIDSNRRGRAIVALLRRKSTTVSVPWWSCRPERRVARFRQALRHRRHRGGSPQAGFGVSPAPFSGPRTSESGAGESSLPLRADREPHRLRAPLHLPVGRENRHAATALPLRPEGCGAQVERVERSDHSGERFGSPFLDGFG